MYYCLQGMFICEFWSYNNASFLITESSNSMHTCLWKLICLVLFLTPNVAFWLLSLDRRIISFINNKDMSLLTREQKEDLNLRFKKFYVSSKRKPMMQKESNCQTIIHFPHHRRNRRRTFLIVWIFQQDNYTTLRN